MVKYANVESSNISAIGYDAEDSSLYVRFAVRKGSTGSTYKYLEVPPEVHEKLMNSPSKGKALSLLIKDQYEYEKL